MDTAEIADLLEPFVGRLLSHAQLQNISMYVNVLLRWNPKINLTSVARPEEIVTRHFGESLFVARHLFSGMAGGGPALAAKPGEGLRVVDVGSGAGFPGLPIKIWAPQIRLTLVESNHKKATFLREVARTLTLTNVDVLAERAELLPARSAEVVTLRAVERFASILPIAARMVTQGGYLALLIGRDQVRRAIELAPSFEWQEQILIPLSTARVIELGRSKKT